MKKIRTVYLSLGSNQGNKLQNLQKAVDLIAEKIGVVVSIAKIYKTAALGFDGNEFYNTCIHISTYLSNNEIIDTVLDIEKQIGRVRKENSGYTNRPIDIDVLLINNEIIDSSKLMVPHPRMLDRKFVLAPLCDIASNYTHPITNTTIGDCLANSNDSSNIYENSETLKIPSSISNKYNYIAIEGNIGAGKTSLATMIANQYHSKLILEQFNENPFLAKFYENQKRYAFPLEMKFLADRYQQLSDKLIHNSSELVIADYYIFKSLIFAEVTLEKEEFKLYKTMFDILYTNIKKPDLYVYLYQDTECLLNNIQKRGRNYESNIQAKYLEKINEGYLKYINKQQNLNTLIIDISELNFIDNPKSYNSIINQIINA